MSHNKSYNNDKKEQEYTRKEQVTTLESLRQYGTNGAIVELPPFDDNMPLVVKIKRPSLMGLISTGTIPNSLQAKAVELFEGNSKPAESAEDVKNLMELMEVFAKACLVEPTYEEIEESGVTLTDEQLLAIYRYAQIGSRALEPFRAEQALAKVIDNIKDLQSKTKPTTGNKR